LCVYYIIITDKARDKVKYVNRGVGVVRDEELKLEEVKLHGLGGAGE
jgi:hypothetical protein